MLIYCNNVHRMRGKYDQKSLICPIILYRNSFPLSVSIHSKRPRCLTTQVPLIWRTLNLRKACLICSRNLFTSDPIPTTKTTMTTVRSSWYVPGKCQRPRPSALANRSPQKRPCRAPNPSKRFRSLRHSFSCAVVFNFVGSSLAGGLEDG